MNPKKYSICFIKCSFSYTFAKGFAWGVLPNKMQNVSKMKVLIAEDNLMNQLLMTRYMGRLGWEFVIVDNGLKATEACKSNFFNAILMDIDMPVCDGIEATRNIREFNSKIPIVAITAYADSLMRTRCAEAGMNAFLAKPCSRDEIKAVVAECVEISTFNAD